MNREVNWNELEQWDKKYILRTWVKADEYQWLPIAKTEGNYLFLPDGTKLLDFFNQLYCVNAGQRNPKIQQAIREALDEYGFLWDAFTSKYKPKAAKLLVEDILGSEGWAGKVRFTNSGSEANETAMIIARLYTGKPFIVTREHAYHGYTNAAAGVTRMRCARSQVVKEEGDLRAVPGHGEGYYLVAPAPNCYRCSLGLSYPDCKREGKQLPCVAFTENLILNVGLDKVGTIITEPIHGAATIHPPAEYLPQIAEMRTRLGLVWIADEVLVGFGRTGTWFAYQKWGVKPDILALGKGIVSSALPAGAVIVSKEIAEFMDRHRWLHVSTFSGHPLCMAAICANLEYMLENNLPEKARLAGEYFGQKLNELEAKHKTVGLVAGSGMLWQVELVKNKKTKEYFIPEDRNTDYSGDHGKWPTQIVKLKAIEKGVLMGGFVPNTMRIGASLEVTKEEMDQAIAALDYALDYLDSLA
jgi:taurine--2-oxoglutarate transaminase